MLPGNNMHFIFFPSLSLYHSCHHSPLFCHLPSPPSSVCPVLFVGHPPSDLFFPPHVPSIPPPPHHPLPLLDFQSCLICVARRVPMKERPMLPTHESFTTRQDLQGTPTSAGLMEIFLCLTRSLFCLLHHFCAMPSHR